MIKDIKPTVGSDDNVTATANTAPPNQGPAAAETAPTAEPSDESQRRAEHSSEIISPNRKNALVHGVYASDLVLPWESEEDLVRLHQTLVKDHKPKGALEEETVFTLTQLHWRKRRIAMAAQLEFRSDPLLAGSRTLKTWQDVLNEVEHGANLQWKDIQRARISLAKIINELLDRDAAVNKKVAVDNEAAQSGVPPKSSDPKQPQSKDELMKEVSEIANRVKANMSGQTPYSPALPALQQEFQEIIAGLKNVQKLQTAIEFAETEALTRFHSPQSCEKMIKAEAAIDTRIDKTISRLLLLQEYRRREEHQASLASAIPHDTTATLVPRATDEAISQ